MDVMERMDAGKDERKKEKEEREKREKERKIKTCLKLNN